MKNTKPFYIPDAITEKLIDEGSIAKTCVLLLESASKHNGMVLSTGAIAKCINMNSKTIDKCRKEIEKDMNERV